MLSAGSARCPARGVGRDLWLALDRSTEENGCMKVIPGSQSNGFSEYHPVDSSEAAFKTAGSVGFKAAFSQANPVLLEPVMHVEVTVPEEHLGAVTGDLNARRAEITEVLMRGKLRVIEALVPLRLTFDYSEKVRSLSCICPFCSPAGVEDGIRIRLAGEGEVGVRGAAAGDLFIFISVTPHRIFQRDGAHIHCRVPLPITTAALGGAIEVPTVDGSRTRVTVPAGTQSGHQFRLRGKGMTVLRSAARGDMFIEQRVNYENDRFIFVDGGPASARALSYLNRWYASAPDAAVTTARP